MSVESFLNENAVFVKALGKTRIYASKSTKEHENFPHFLSEVGYIATGVNDTEGIRKESPPERWYSIDRDHLYVAGCRPEAGGLIYLIFHRHGEGADPIPWVEQMAVEYKKDKPAA